MTMLFEPINIKNMVLRNRFVRSATGDNGADANGVTEKQMELFRGLAKGGAGLIITGMTGVSASGRMRASQGSLASDRYIPGFRRLTDEVHRYGSKIAVQLAHAGRERAMRLAEEDEPALAPSFVSDDPHFKSSRYRAMTEDEIVEVIGAFGDAAQRAKEAGFDGVQVHGAHAYLLAEFLSPYTNRRSDRWGGSLENRLRLYLEVLGAIRKKVGEEYPVLLKLGVEDGFPGGLRFQEGERAALLLAEAGFDGLEISQGLRGKAFEETEFRTDIDRPEREAYFRHWCREIKSHVSVPVMMVGGLRSFALMDQVVGQGEADFISLCRPFIREPDIVNRWESGDRRPAACISCNDCFAALRRGEPIYCPQLDA